MAAAAIGAAGSIASGMMQADAQRAAAAAQERIAQQNIAFQRYMYDQNVARMDPWVQYGNEQRNALAGLMPQLTSRYDMAKYQLSPEYQNIMAQTDRERKALEAKSSASGMYGSGTMANQLQANAAYLGQQGYQQGLQNYMNQNRTIYDMLNTGSNVGLNAAGMQSNLGANIASNVGNIYNSMGNAQANSIANQGNIWGGTVNNISSLLGQSMNSYDKQQQLSGGSTIDSNIMNYLSDLFGGSSSSPTLSNVGAFPSMSQGDGTGSYVSGGMSGNWTGNPALNNLYGGLY